MIVIFEVIVPIIALIVITSVCVIDPVVSTAIANIVCVCNLHCLHDLEYFQYLLLHRVDYRIHCWLDEQFRLVIRWLRYWD